MLKAAYRSFFATPQGKMVIADLKRICFVNSSTAVPNDPYRTYYNEGARGVFLTICNKANLSIDRIMGATQVSDNR